MKIPFTEPTAPRYIYINPKSNKMHVFKPVVSGNKIGLDNTCKSVFALQEFFGKSRDVHQRAALDELIAYEKALEFDITLIGETAIAKDIKLQPIKEQKQERLKQIKNYIVAINTVQESPVLDGLGQALPSYPEPLQQIMCLEDSNVHAMLLRPAVLDDSIRFVNPVFSVKRKAQSALYNALTDIFKNITIPGAQARLFTRVLASPAGKSMDFKGIQQELTEAFKQQFETNIDFTKSTNGASLSQEFIDNSMLYDVDNPATSEKYIKALLYYCAKDYFASLVEPVFYSAKHSDELVVITQFFLAHINIYCRSNKLSAANFGAVLDNSDEELCTTLAAVVYSCIISLDGADIEDALLDFVNENSAVFGLENPLQPKDKAQIKQKFTENFAQIKESQEFDEFIVLDDSKPGPFIAHQNAICLDFAEFVGLGFPNLNPEFFAAIRKDFKEAVGTITHHNPWIHADIELSVEELLEHIHDKEQLDLVLKKLPKQQQEEFRASPAIQKMQVSKFLHCIARGQQKEAEDLLKANPHTHFLLQEGEFTYYSGRTFKKCTAYEYAYWAKDTHMCRMLEKYMDEDTKKEVHQRCVKIDKEGLEFVQNGETKKSSHFDLTPLKTALKEYIDGFEAWLDAKEWAKLDAAWMKVGKAQRDIPAHVAHEYCRRDRSFDPTPNFKEIDLPRTGTYYNWSTERDESWFPLHVSDSEGLGVNFALCRGKSAASIFRGAAEAPHCSSGSQIGYLRAALGAEVDLAAVSRLDEVRTVDLDQSLENLKSANPGSGLGPVFS